MCEIPGCEIDKYIERHRIQPGRDRGKYLMGNVIGLCPYHHAAADHGDLEAIDLYEIVRLRLERDFHMALITEEVYLRGIAHIDGQTSK